MLLVSQVKKFQFNVDHLEMGQNVNVSISSVNVYDTEVSAANYIVFDTPTCLEYYADLTICSEYTSLLLITNVEELISIREKPIFLVFKRILISTV